jgi:hypothetical protein
MIECVLERGIDAITHLIKRFNFIKGLTKNKVYQNHYSFNALHFKDILIPKKSLQLVRFNLFNFKDWVR